MKLITILFFLLLQTSVWADCLLSSSNCIIAGRDDASDIITVKTINDTCYNTCSDYCKHKFKMNLINGNNNDNQNNTSFSISNIAMVMNNIQNVNKDRITQCMQSCFRGQQFDSTIRIPIKLNTNTGNATYYPCNNNADCSNNPYPWLCDINSNVDDPMSLACDNDISGSSSSSSGSVCNSTALQSSYVKGNVSVTSNSKVIVSLANPNQAIDSTKNNNDLLNVSGNNVYLCGVESMFFSPNFWRNTNSSDVGIKGTDQTSKIFDPRNQATINTGIFIQDGDYLEVKYDGIYQSNCQIINNSIQCTHDDRDYYIYLSVNNKILNFSVPTQQINDKSKDEQTEAAKNNQINQYQVNQNQSYTTSLFNNNLQTFVSWLNFPKIFTAPLYPNDKEKTSYRSTLVYGTLKNISNNPNELIISYNNPNKLSYGGYLVSVTWRGCNYKNGERLQYAVINQAIEQSAQFEQYMISYVQWRDLPVNAVETGMLGEIQITSQDLTIPDVLDIQSDLNVNAVLPNDPSNYKGSVYFRIKTLDNDNVHKVNRENTIGQYYIKLSLSGSSNLIVDVIRNKFMSFLNGMPEKIFNAFQSNNQYITIIRLLLILYIAFIGLTFMTGMAKINQQEGLSIIFKISVVVMLLSNTSFAFFNQYLFQFFSFDMMNKLANIFTPDIDFPAIPGLSNDTGQCLDANVKLLCILEKDLELFFSWAFWNRIIGLLISGFFIAAIGIIIGVIVYATVIIKVIVLYCVGLIALGLTISLAPIFIPFILFKYTKTLFDAWIKQLMILITQPLFIFTAVSLFRLIFLSLIQVIMGKSACKICWIEFEFLSTKYCLFDMRFYQPISFSSSPTPYSLPMSSIGSIVAIFFVSSAMRSFVDFTADIGSRLINFSGFNLGDVKSSPAELLKDAKDFASPITRIAKSPLKALTIDDESRNTRSQNRKVRRQKQEENKKKNN